MISVFNKSVQNIYFDRNPHLRRMAALKARSIGLPLIVPAEETPILEWLDERKALDCFLELIPSMKEGSIFFISSRFAMEPSAPNGLQVARYIKDTVKDSKVYFVTMFSNDYEEEILNGTLDGVFSKEAILEIPHDFSKLTENERAELQGLIENV